MIWRGLFMVLFAVAVMATGRSAPAQDAEGPTIIDIVVDEDFDASGRRIYNVEVSLADGPATIRFTCAAIVREVGVGLSSVNQGDAEGCTAPSIQPRSPELNLRIQNTVLAALAGADVGGRIGLQEFVSREEEFDQTTSSIVSGEGENQGQDTTTILLETLPLCSELATPEAGVNCRLQ